MSRLRLVVVAAAAAAGIAAAVAVLLPSPAAASPRLVTVTQDYTDGCVPAAGSMLLSAVGISVSQDVLARQMGTYRHHQTFTADATRVLDGYLRGRGLRLVNGGFVPSAQLAALLRSTRLPVMVSVWAVRLPWRRSDKTVFIHTVLVTGIRGEMVTLWDPEVRALHGGWHVLPVWVLDPALIGTGVVVRRVSSA